MILLGNHHFFLKLTVVRRNQEINKLIALPWPYLLLSRININLISFDDSFIKIRDENVVNLLLFFQRILITNKKREGIYDTNCPVSLALFNVSVMRKNNKSIFKLFESTYKRWQALMTFLMEVFFSKGNGKVTILLITYLPRITVCFKEKRVNF